MKHRKSAFITVTLIALTALLFIASYAFSEVYRWVDDKGQIHITDYPNPNQPLPKELTPVETAPAPEAAPAPAEAKKPPAKPEAPQKAPMETAQAPKKEETKPAPTAAEKKGSLKIPAQVKQSEKKPLQPAVPPAAEAQKPAAPPIEKLPAFPKAVPGMPLPLAGIIAGFMIIYLIFMAAIYIFFSLCLFLIAKKLNVSAPWIAFIPFAQIWTLVSAAGKPWWWILLLIVPLVNFFVLIYLWMLITENLGKNKWLGLLMLVPLVNLVFLGMLAFSKGETAAPSAYTPSEPLPDLPGEDDFGGPAPSPPE